MARKLPSAAATVALSHSAICEAMAKKCLRVTKAGRRTLGLGDDSAWWLEDLRHDGATLDEEHAHE